MKFLPKPTDINSYNIDFVRFREELYMIITTKIYFTKNIKIYMKKYIEKIAYKDFNFKFNSAY